VTRDPRRSDGEPTISVVVPAYDRETTIGETLDSLLAQTHSGWHAIVVDDGSADGTAGVVEAYGARDARIRVHRQPNGGVSRARNVGIGLAHAPWLFFLDADDWIDPSTFERLNAALQAEPSADVAYGGYVRVDERGRELQRQLPALEDDLFPLFARTCAVSIHSCLVRSELVRHVGGFDETLVTCEDWDLWQRIARSGARFTAIPDYVASYRMRVGSASGRGRRMLSDGLLVIDRGHGEDPRVAEPALARAPLSRSARDLARTYFLCYAAGLEIAAGADARDMLDELGDGLSGDVDPSGVAETLFHAIPVGLACTVGDWPHFPDAVHRGCLEFVDALADRVGDHWLAFQARGVLERLQLAAAEGERPARAGRWYLIELDLDGAPPDDLQLDPGVERLLCSVRLGDKRLADVELPVVDGWVPARVLADAVVASQAWDVLQAFFEREVYAQLRIEPGDGRVRVERDGVLLFDGALDPGRTTAQGVHDAVGWTVLLQELWNLPHATGEELYAAAPRRGRAHAAEERSLTTGTEAVELDLAEPLPSLRTLGAEPPTVAVTVGGVPLTVFECEAGERVSAHRLRRAILMHSGFELCRAVLREAVVLAPAPARGTLRERLAAGLSAERAGARPLDVTVVAQAGDGTPSSRWTPLPAVVAPERLELARRDGDRVLGPTDGVRRLLAAPLGRVATRRATDDALLRSLEFDRVFGSGADPWHYDSPYEQEKYRRTLELLPGRPARALELGCAEGAFTRRLAERVDALLAVDISERALSRARRRCREQRHVAFVQLDLFEDPIRDRYELVVCSELLYYAERRETLARTARKLAGALESGGHLLTAHAHAVVDDATSAGFDWDVPFGAAAIEQALLATRELELVREIRTAPYRVQLYRRRARRRLGRPRARPERTLAPAVAPPPDAAACFLPSGGPVRREPVAEEPRGARRMPILMYHRVAPEGRAATQRWRLHPDAFEAQLAYLREHDYQSLTFEQWRAASDRRIPIPARSVLLTFDDGYADFPTHALPLLVKYGFRATMFVVTDLVGASNVWDEQLDERIALMDWPTLLELDEQGVELGSHTASHRPLVSLSTADVARELCRSRSALHERLGSGVRSICYPYGLHDAAVLSLAGGCGYHFGVTTNEWHASFGDDLLELPRVEVRGGDTLTEFVAKLRG
jgi:peptidoglycan/xylan/chitin deacetylase (PgdA/CDA1 family)